MIKKIYEISSTGVQIIPATNRETNNYQKTSVYLYDIQFKDRQETVSELELLEVDEDILEDILEPAENIRFDFYKDSAYGELAHFSPHSEDPVGFISVIITDNKIVLLRREDENEDIIKNTFESFSKMVDKRNVKTDVVIVFYILVVELITKQGKMLLNYRERIEDIAKEFDSKLNDIEPDDFLNAKSHLSDFARVLEKLHFTLFFPPAKSILDKNSTYRQYFEELLKTVEMQKDSLTQSEHRLNSLHAHYLLLLQEKSNKRINFLTIIQAIFVPLTLLTGMYGMNFVNIPELNFKYGYFCVLGAMVVIASLFLRYFYKHGWFK